MSDFRVARRPTYSRYAELFDLVAATVGTQDAVYVPRAIANSTGMGRAFRLSFPNLRLRSKRAGVANEVALWAEERTTA